jgi:hypothetical protein
MTALPLNLAQVCPGALEHFEDWPLLSPANIRIPTNRTQRPLSYGRQAYVHADKD